MEVGGLKLLIPTSRDLYFTILTSMHLVLPAVLASMSFVLVRVRVLADRPRRKAVEHIQTSQLRKEYVDELLREAGRVLFQLRAHKRFTLHQRRPFWSVGPLS